MLITRAILDRSLACHSLPQWMIRDTAGFRLPLFAYCQQCARHHPPRWFCLGYLAAAEALSLLSPQNPLRRRWWYRGADHNLYVSLCRDCALRADVADAHSGFVVALVGGARLPARTSPTRLRVGSGRRRRGDHGCVHRTASS